MKTALIIDDQPEILDALSKYLTESNWNVTCISDAETYIDKHKKKSYDLIIVDLILPKMTGMTLIKDHFPKNQKIIVISGFMSAILGNEFFKNKNITFIEKPFKCNELMLAIHNLMIDVNDENKKGRHHNKMITTILSLF